MSSQTVHCIDERKPAIAANIKLSSLGSNCCNEYNAMERVKHYKQFYGGLHDTEEYKKINMIAPVALERWPLILDRQAFISLIS